jgi:arginine exporter protein ArgO
MVIVQVLEPDGWRMGLWIAFACAVLLVAPAVVIGTLALVGSLAMLSRSRSFLVGGVAASAPWVITLFATPALFLVALGSLLAVALIAGRL